MRLSSATAMAGHPLSTSERVVFTGILILCVVSLPTLIAHIRGRSRRIEEAVTLMAASDRFRSRLAGGIHLSWGALASASIGVLAGAAGWDVVDAAVGFAFALLMLADLSVFFTGRPRTLLLPRYRDERFPPSGDHDR